MSNEYDLLFKNDGTAEYKELLEFFENAVKNGIPYGNKRLILSFTLFNLSETIKLSETKENKRYIQLKKYLVDNSRISITCKDIVPDKSLPGLKKKRIALEFKPIID
jgi:hypothetical protein